MVKRSGTGFFEIRKPGCSFIEKKGHSCVWLKNKSAALSEPLKSPNPVIVSRHLQLEAARMFVVVLKASECGFHMVYFLFGGFLHPPSNFPHLEPQAFIFCPIPCMNCLSVKGLSTAIVAQIFKHAKVGPNLRLPVWVIADFKLCSINTAFGSFCFFKHSLVQTKSLFKSLHWAADNLIQTPVNMIKWLPLISMCFWSGIFPQYSTQQPLLFLRKQEGPNLKVGGRTGP